MTHHGTNIKARRLLVICHGFPPYYGGAEHAAYYLARAAAATGRFQVTVLTSDIGGRLESREMMDGIEVLRVPTKKKEWTQHSVPELISFLRAARRQIPKLLLTQHPDRIIAHFSLPAGAVAYFMKRRWNFPYSVVLHGSDVPGYQPARFGFAYRLIRGWTRRIWQKASNVIAVSESLRELALQTWPRGTIATIPNGVDLSRFQSLEHAAPPTSRDWKSIVVIAQLIERKGIQQLLGALAKMAPEERQALRVAVHGTGPYESQLKAVARKLGLEEAVTFHGLARHDAIPGILHDADVFVLPTLQEAMPLTVMEAMAAGKPIVATAVGGIPTLISDGKEGLLVPPGDVEALKNAIIRLRQNPALADSLAKAARAKAQSYDWSEIWKRYEQLMVRNQTGGAATTHGSSMRYTTASGRTAW